MATNEDADIETEIEPASTDVEPAPEPETRAAADDDDGDKPAPQAQAPRKTRKDFRQARVDVEAARAEAAEIRRALEAERGERQRIDRELAELRATARTVAERNTDDGFKQKLTQLRAKANQHLVIAAQNDKNPAIAQREMEAYYDTLDEIQDARHEHRESRRQPAQTQSGPDPAALAMWSALSAEHDWLNDDAHVKARQSAGHYASALIAQGKPDNLQTYREACAMAAQAFKIGGRQAPTSGQRARYTGVPSRSGDSENDGREVVRMGRHEESMAEAAYAHLPPEEAHKAWARDVGRHVNGQNR